MFVAANKQSVVHEVRWCEEPWVAGRERIASHCYSIHAIARRLAIVREADGCP